MIHLVKLCVGVREPAQLRSHVSDLRPELGELLAIRTRSTPKRIEELLAGGSMYWVMSGAVRARQEIVAVRTVEENGAKHCVIALHPDVHDTSAAPYRPFQGWRYLEPDRAPPDMAPGMEEMPEEMRRALADLGLA